MMDCRKGESDVEFFVRKGEGCCISLNKIHIWMKPFCLSKKSCGVIDSGIHNLARFEHAEESSVSAADIDDLHPRSGVLREELELLPEFRAGIGKFPCHLVVGVLGR